MGDRFHLPERVLVMLMDEPFAWIDHGDTPFADPRTNRPASLRENCRFRICAGDCLSENGNDDR